VANPVAIMLNRAYGHAGEQFSLEIQVTYWLRTGTQFKPPEDFEGVGIFIANSDYSEYFCLGSFDNEGTQANPIETWAFWHVVGASPEDGRPGFGDPNLEPLINYDTDTVEVTYRLHRTATTIEGEMRTFENAFSNKGSVTVTGTALGLDRTLKVGAFVNEPVVTCIDWFASPYEPCTMGAGGDGVTGLTTSPAGTSHDYSWALGNDMAMHPGAYGHLFGEIRMLGTDTHGQGPWDVSPWFEIEGGVIPPTPTPTPVCSYHDSDYNPQDWSLDLIGVQLLIQRFNTGGAYQCGTPGVQDGYTTGSGDQSCGPHSADYNDNWIMDLLEVQRCVQFFNVGAYHCQEGTVDGYAPGP
jgi:hypothetical protein